MQPQLSVRSAKARELAHRLARTEGRTIASIVVRALEAYAHRHAETETPEAFYRRLAKLGESKSEGPDLSEILDSQRRPHLGLDL